MIQYGLVRVNGWTAVRPIRYLPLYGGTIVSVALSVHALSFIIGRLPVNHHGSHQSSVHLVDHFRRPLDAMGESSIDEVRLKLPLRSDLAPSLEGSVYWTVVRVGRLGEEAKGLVFQCSVTELSNSI